MVSIAAFHDLATTYLMPCVLGRFQFPCPCLTRAVDRWQTIETVEDSSPASRQRQERVAIRGSVKFSTNE